MTKINKTPIGLILILVVALGAYWVLAPRFFGQAELEIDSDWWIVYNDQDQGDQISARTLQNEYGCLLVSIDTAEDENLNTEGQNLLFIGGSETFSGKVPWFETWPTLTVLKPSGQPDVYLYWEADWATEGDAYIHTPFQNYYMAQNGEFLHEYGVVTKAYDSTLKRWIIVCVGWSGFDTYAGAKLLIEDFELVQQKSWIVYEVTEQGATDPSTWTLNQFQYEIVDSN